uniref:Putative wall-associated receptor kinase-like 14 n=1 Tax=Davidia involucrata TaxID=16924 RepID=A0A5B6Z1L4_DAVIN
MNMLLLHQTIIAFVLATFIISSTKALTSAHCKQTCRHNRVPYPFGFSDGCQIRLNCSEKGEIRVGEFRVQNVTRDSILINLPAKCNRPIQDIEQLFQRNYALTWQNGLLLQNCSSSLNGCAIAMSTVESRFDQLQGCDSGSDNISCYSENNKGIDVMTFANLRQTNCRFLFSSIAVDLSNNSNKNSTISLEFQTVELGWWLDGPCNCTPNADCTVVTLANGTTGFRCRCKQGFEGDGFVNSDGCHKVACNASKYMSGRCGGTTRVDVLIGGIIVGASLMAALALICYFIRRRSTSFKSRMSAKRLLCEAAGNSSVPFYTYKEIERASNGFSEKQRLGTGAYGTVYAGKLHNDEWVAIKKIRHRDSDGIEQVMNEIKLLSSVSHPNLVRLLGCCIENDEQILVYEFMPNGTLSQHLQRDGGRCLPWTIRLTIATETAHAIA